ncbi:MAG: fibrobacter succinogenes major paralogous domain-containing protein [Bacteroidales bacterium]|nr:fibrobacter succinogenes major paralogous domain-containing protein [Bacteroidales bacterium]
MKRINKLNWKSSFLLSLLFPLLLVGCKKDEESTTSAPVLGETEISVITTSFGNCISEIISLGSSDITAKGFCWSSYPLPTIDDFISTNSSGDLDAGFYSGIFNGFELNTTYYIRSWATNADGTGYGAQLEFHTPRNSILDYDGNSYSSLIIGNQEWLVQNLKVTHLQDGTEIPNVTDHTAWEALSTPAYCWYDNASANKDTYGALYNWATVNTGQLCPDGWHVPSESEWATLVNFLGGESLAGGRLKEPGIFHWISPNVGPGDSYFYALPGGKRGNSTVGDGEFLRMGSYAYWWTSTEIDADNANSRSITNGSDYIYNYGNRKEYGLSVRCISD